MQIAVAPGNASPSSEETVLVGGVLPVVWNSVPEAPRIFNSSDAGKCLRISNDGLSVLYHSTNETEANSVRTNVPVPLSGIAVFYFEVTIVDIGMNPYIGIGLSGGSVDLENMPGWRPDSFGYHGDDGQKYVECGDTGIAYGPTFGTGDVIGMCWDVVDNLVFYTKNGASLHYAFAELSGFLYPTIGMLTSGGCVTANFGASPFVYNIDAYSRQRC